LLYLAGVEPSDDALRVVVADDHHLFREGLRRMLATDGIAVVGEATDGMGAVALARKLAPEIVVVDLKMPRVSGTDAVREIVRSNPDVRVLVLTVSADESDVLEALDAGACGYMLKDAGAEELVGGIRMAAGGQTVLAREVARALVARACKDSRVAEQTPDQVPALTTREREVLGLMTDGLDNAAIGRELSISRHTVKQYVTNILEKLGVRSRVEAAIYAVRNGLV